MNKRIATLVAGAFPVAMLAFAAAPAADDQKPQPVTVRGTVHSIKLPEVKAELPSAPGREAIETYCAVCHTTNYILIQPRFSKETWTAEVTKMQKTYMAPIPDEKIPELVGYLMSVRGAHPAK
jgi:cytochrome c5